MRKGKTKQIVDAFLKQCALGKSIKTISKDPSMPGFSTLWKWISEDEEINKKYWLAKQVTADIYAEEIVDIADDGSNDWMESNDPKNAGYALNKENIQRSRLRVDARKWSAAKLMPKRYSERVANEISGPDGGAVEGVVTINFNPVSRD